MDNNKFVLDTKLTLDIVVAHRGFDDAIVLCCCYRGFVKAEGGIMALLYSVQCDERNIPSPLSIFTHKNNTTQTMMMLATTI